MKELGAASQKLHKAIGKKAVENGVEKLFLIGTFAANIASGAGEAGLKKNQIFIAENQTALVEAVEKEMKAGDIVLVKASRGMQLEKVVEALKEEYGA